MDTDSSGESVFRCVSTRDRKEVGRPWHPTAVFSAVWGKGIRISVSGASKKDVREGLLRMLRRLDEEPD